MNKTNIAQHPISTALIFLLLTGWLICDSRFDFAMDVKLASMFSTDNGEIESLKSKITPNSTTPDIQVNWFSGTSSLTSQFLASNSTNKNEDNDSNTSGKVISEGPANDFP